MRFMSENGSSTRLRWAIGVAIVGLTAAAYYQVLGHDFVAIDDHAYVSENEHIRNGLTLDGWRFAWTQAHGSNWHPLTSISHMIDCTLFGLDAGKHHLVNWWLHTANSVLLFLVLVRMTGHGATGPMASGAALGTKRRDGSRSNRARRKRAAAGNDRDASCPDKATAAGGESGDERPTVWMSGLVAALFAVHPLHVESVAWVSERKDVLSTLFWLGTMWAYVGYVRRPTRRGYAWTTLLLALGLMSKPMVVTLPAALLLLDWWPLRRLNQAGSAASAASTTSAAGRASAAKGRKKAPSEAAATAPAPSGPWWRAWVPLVIEKWPWFALAAVSSVVTFYVQRTSGSMHSAETIPLGLRLQNAVISYGVYLWKMVWPVGLAYFYPHPAMRGGVSAAQLVAAAVALGGITAAVVYWGRRKPYLPSGWFWYLGTLVPVIGVVQVGDQALADRYTYIPSIGIFVMAVWGAVDLLGRWGLTRRVGAPVSVAVLLVLTVLTWRQVATWHDTATLAEHAIGVTKGNYSAWYLKGVAAMRRGETDEAMRAFRRSLEIHPGFANARFDLGKLLIDADRLDEAEDHFRRLEKVRPDLARRGLNVVANRRAVQWYARGTELLRAGKPAQAAECFRETIRLYPRHAAALNDLAWILATSPDDRLRDGAEALRLAQKATKLDRSSLMLDTLAAAYAEAGQFDRAVQTAQEAIRLAQSDPQQMMPPGIEARLELYRQRKPYRDQ